jgi:uncharacterized membrane protein
MLTNQVIFAFKYRHMTSFSTVMLILHIISGFTALTMGFLSMLNRKGGKRHRLTGKIFFGAMTGVFITATFISIVKGLAFLFMVGFFSYYLACSGYRILYLKKFHLNMKPKAIDWLINLAGVFAGLALIIFSVGWFRERGAWGIVPLTFGLGCFLSGIQDIRRFYYPPVNKLQRIISHGSRMGGSFASTLTAFIVVNLSIGPYTWILWILPGILVGIWISRAIKGYAIPKKNTGPVAINH